MEITRASESHVPGIVEVWREFMDFHKDIDPRFPLSADAPANWEKHLRELMKSQDDLILVALDSDTTVGYATAALVATAPLWERRTYGQISDMAVTSAYRRRGLGEQMFGYIMEWFASKDIRRVELSVASRNLVGYPFWRKHGFKDYVHRLYLDTR